MSGLLGFIVGLALLWGAGRGLLRLFGGGPTRAVMGCEFLSGAAFTGLMLQVPLAIDGRITHATFALAAGICGVLTIVGLRGDWSARRGWTLWNWLGWLGPLAWPSRIVGVVGVGLFVWTAAFHPGVGYDSRSIYRLKAKLLYDSGDTLAEDFQDVDLINFNSSYPLLIPALEAELFWFAGGVEETGLQLLFAAFVLSAASLVVDAIRRFETSRWAGLWGLLFLLTPFVGAVREGGGLSGCADLPFACFVLGAILGPATASREASWRDAAVRGLFGGAALVTKPEGVIWLALAMAAFVIARLRERSFPRPLRGRAAIAFAIIAAALGMKAAIQSRIPANPYHRHYIAALTPEWLSQVGVRVPEIAEATLWELVDVKWGFGWIALAGSLVLLRRRVPTPPSVRFARWMIGAPLATYLAVFLVTPLHLGWHLESALPRLLLHLFPLAVVVTAEQAAAAGWTTAVVEFVTRLARPDGHRADSTPDRPFEPAQRRAA